MSRVEQRFTFNAIAARYARARPGYPDAVFEAIRRAVGREASPRLLEVGAGTGKATVALARQGFDVVALEPGPAMIEQAREAAAGLKVRLVRTTLEDWQPEDRAAFDAVAAAQAWHWIDPSVGYLKAAAALAPDGVLALFGTVTPFPPGAMKDALSATYSRHAPELRSAQTSGPLETYYTPEGPLTAQISGSGLFGPMRHEAFPWVQSYGTADYLDLISTFSDHQMLGESRLEPLLHDLGEVIEAHGGQVRLRCQTNLFMARKL